MSMTTLTILSHGRLCGVLFTLLSLLAYTTEAVVDNHSIGKSVHMLSQSKLSQEVPLSLDDLQNRHVLLSPPTDLRIYFVSNSAVVLHWSAPSVFITHDVKDASMTLRNAPGPYVLKKSGDDSGHDSNQTDGNITGVHLADLISTEMNTSTSSPKTKAEIQCHSMIFFANYTVALKSAGDVHNVTYKTVSFQSTPDSHKRLTVTGDGKRNILVSFEEGCLTHYVLLWTENILGGVTETGDVSKDVTVFTISGLKSDTEYKVSIKAYYVSGDSIELASPMFFRTKNVNQTNVCICNWQGGANNVCIKFEENQRACYCKKGYAGRFCEHCAAGFYRTSPYYPCHRCPCPIYAAKTPTCKFDEGFLECGQCQLGYTGNICHKCADGFYMKGRKCVPCFCHGNTPPDSMHMCKPTNGECYDCQHNTTGHQCQFCLPDYIGDPITYKNCAAAPLAEGRRSIVSPGAVGAAVVVVGLLLILTLVGLVYYRRYREHRARNHFWTVEMNREQDDVGFNPVARDDSHLNGVDDLKFYEPQQGGQPKVNKYSRLNEQM